MMEYGAYILAFLSFIGIPIARSVAGWAVKALKDSKITEFEWKELVSTVIRVGLMSFLAYIGFNGAGIDMPPLAAGAAAYFADRIIDALKDNINKR